MTEYLNKQKKERTERGRHRNEKERRQEGKREQAVNSAFGWDRESNWIIHT